MTLDLNLPASESLKPPYGGVVNSPWIDPGADMVSQIGPDYLENHPIKLIFSILNVIVKITNSFFYNLHRCTNTLPFSSNTGA